MKWSKYNLVFNSEQYGTMVYNSLSNRVMTFKEDFQAEIAKIKADPDKYDFTSNFKLFREMIKNRVLISPDNERDTISAMKMNKMANRFNSSSLELTIMVTEDCNFGCPYCYEQGKRAVDMPEETQDRVMEFIKSHPHLQHLTVCWFGGEPLMRFDTMKRMNSMIAELGIDYDATVVTNGWLLTDEVIESLDELKIGFIQITIDGDKEIHDSKRFHLEHGGSYDKLIENMDKLLLDAKWGGFLNIHYNVDENNAHCMADTREFLLDRYKGSKIQFAVSFVDKTERGARDMGCSFSKEQEIQFYLDYYEKHGGEGLRYYPKKHMGGCTATMVNSYVIGAEGQAYKCWDDVGKKDMEVGSVYEDVSKWDSLKISRYMVGVEQFDNDQCKDCFYLPVCSECPNIWYRKIYNGQNISACANYKNLLPKFLEINHELMLKEKAKQ